MSNLTENRKIIDDYFIRRSVRTNRRRVEDDSLIFVLYLGDESRTCLSDLLRISLRTALCITPAIVDGIHLNLDNGLSADSLRNDIVESIKGLIEKNVIGRDIRKASLNFVGLMHSDFCPQNNISGVMDILEQAVSRLNSDRIINFFEISFFGIFNPQIDKDRINYKKNFEFVSAGYDRIWKNVYHLQKYIFADDYDSECRSIAAKILFDLMCGGNYQRIDYFDGINYYWKRLCLREVSLPEQRLCDALALAYQNQNLGDIIRDNRNNAEVEKNINRALDLTVDHIYPILNNNVFFEAVDHIPMRIEKRSEERKKGFFIKKNDNTEESEVLISYDDIFELMEIESGICSEDSIDLCKVFYDYLFSEMYETNDDLSLYCDALNTINNSLINWNSENARKQFLAIGINSERIDLMAKLERKRNEVKKEIINTALCEDGISYFKNQMDEAVSFSLAMSRILKQLSTDAYGGGVIKNAERDTSDLKLPLFTTLEDALSFYEKNVFGNEALVENRIKEDEIRGLISRAKGVFIGNGFAQYIGDYRSISESCYMLVNQPYGYGIEGIQEKTIYSLRDDEILLLYEEEWNSPVCLSKYYVRETN